MKKIIYLIACIGVFVLLHSCKPSTGGGALTSTDSANIASAYQKSHDVSVVAMTTSVDTSDFKSQGVGNMYITKAKAEEYIRVFEQTIYSDGQNRKPNMSKSVWFSADAINILASYINDPQHKLDGARMHFIAYNQLGSAEGQQDINQLSIAIAPTHKGLTVGNITYHISDWDIIKPKADTIKGFKSRADGLNHGQLCPSVCD